MGELVNLRLEKKRRERAAEAAEAAENRARFGLTKLARTSKEADKLRADTLLDGAKLEPMPPVKG